MAIWPFVSTPKREKKTTDISAYTWTELLGQGGSKAGVTVNVDTALRVSTVFACARVLAEGVAQLPLKVYRTTETPLGATRVPATDHPAFDILYRRPNDWMTSFELREQMMFHAVLCGNAYAYIGWGGRPSRIVEIIPLVPSRVTAVRGTDYSMTYRVSGLDGKTTTLPQENVLHIRGPSWDGYLGLDAVRLAREAIGLAIATEETHASLHANGAQPGGILTIKGKLDEPSRERLKLAWAAMGSANKFKTAVVDMDSDWKSMAMTGVDSQHIETRRFQIEEICRAMRVFPQMVMHSDKTSTFASAESFFLAHVTHSLMPWITRWEHTLEHALFDDKDKDLIVKFNVNGLLRGTPTERFTAYQTVLGGARPETAWMTRNEVRELEDLDPIDGGDKLPEPVPVVAPVAAKEAKYNHVHDPAGRFGDRPGGGSDGRGGGGRHSNDHFELSDSSTPATDLYNKHSGGAKTEAEIVAESGFADKVAAAERKIKTGVSTDMLVSEGGFRNPDGTYTEARQAKQQEILDGLFTDEAIDGATPALGEKPTASVLGGRGSSGKSYVTSKAGPVDKNGVIVLDSDYFKKELPGYEGWNAALYHEESSHMLKLADARARELGINVVLDSTLKSKDVLIERAAAFTSAGYNLNGYYVFASPTEAASRAVQRVFDKPNGRFVPPHIILENVNNERNFDAMKADFGRWAVYDNMGDAPKMTAKGGKW